MPQPNFLEKRCLKLYLTFLPLLSLFLKRMSLKTKCLSLFPQLRLFSAICSSTLPLTHYQGSFPCSFWTTATTACKHILLLLGTSLTSDVAAPPADCIPVSLPKLQNLSVIYKSSWPLEFKPDKLCL